MYLILKYNLFFKKTNYDKYTNTCIKLTICDVVIIIVYSNIYLSEHVTIFFSPSKDFMTDLLSCINAIELIVCNIIRMILLNTKVFLFNA